MKKQNGDPSRRGVLYAGVALLAAPAIIRRAAADEPVQLLSHRYPALEFYADKIKTALPDVPVNARLMPSGDAASLERIAFSSGDTSLDLLWANSAILPGYAKSGWLEPLDDLWAKHRAEFRLDDISPASLKGVSYDGHIYAMPITTNTLLYAYRDDLFAEKKLAPPASWDEAVQIAKTLNSPRRSGITLSLKWDQPPYELQSVLNTVGDGWFDKDFHPAFNDARGVAAIETIKRLVPFAVPGYTAQVNDESTVNFAQDVAATGQQWATRCSTMDNPDKSHVVGKIKWAVPPGGHQGLSTDAYAISRNSRRDKDMLFRILATALNEQNQRSGAALAVPTRRAVLNDPAIQAKYRWYPAVSAALDAAQPFPALPEFIETAELSTKRMVQAIVGQMGVKEALDAGAAEVSDLLKRRGYNI
jgi:ABC-type glycerol-3-phosphate transport system substrate-binding protein